MSAPFKRVKSNFVHENQKSYNNFDFRNLYIPKFFIQNNIHEEVG